MSDLMQFDLDNGIGVLRFTRPERRSPYSIAFVDELLLQPLMRRKLMMQCGRL